MNTAASTRSYRQTARAEATQRTREALFEETQRVFFAGDWDELSLDQIAAGAGTTKQTLLRHFGSKQGLFDKAADYWRSRALGQRDEAPIGDVAGVVDNLLAHYEAAGESVLRLLAAEGRSDNISAQLQSGRDYHYAWVDRVFEPWLQALPPAARERRRAALIAACDVYAWRILALDLGLPHRKVRATLIETIDRLLREDP